MKKTSGFFTSAFLILILPLMAACAANSSYSETAAGLDKEKVTLIFPDLPIPAPLEINEDESVIISSPGYQGGLIILKGSLSPVAVQNYFLDTLPQKGWKFVSSLNAGRGLMAFSKDGNGQCLITYSRTSFGYTRVEIWMAEPISERGEDHGAGPGF